jgi:hypothetical protein
MIHLKIIAWTTNFIDTPAVGSKVDVGPFSWYPAAGTKPLERSMPTLLTVTTVNTADKYFIGRTTTRVTLTSAKELYKVIWSGCCRLTNMAENNGDHGVTLTAYHNTTQLSSPRATGWSYSL